MPGEDGFDEEGAGEEGGEPSGDGGEDGVDGVLEGVADDDGVVGESFGGGCADVVLVEGVEHGAAG